MEEMTPPDLPCLGEFFVSLTFNKKIKVFILYFAHFFVTLQSGNFKLNMAKKQIKAAKDAEMIGTSKELYN